MVMKGGVYPEVIVYERVKMIMNLRGALMVDTGTADGCLGADCDAPPR